MPKRQQPDPEMQTFATSTTSDARINAVLGTLHWAPASGQTLTQLTYSFPSVTSSWSYGLGEYGGASGTNEPMSGFAPLAAAQQDAVRSALAAWATVANLTFSETADAGSSAGTLRFGWTAAQPSGLQADAYVPGALQKSGDVWLNAQASWDGFFAGSYGYSTLLHETGHALGLKDSSVGTNTLPAAQDSYANTLMSYNAFAGSPGSWVAFEPSTPMLYDILAIQAVYGANTSYHTGNDVYVFAQGSKYFQTIWDAGGSDTLRWDAATQGATIDLREGHFSSLGDALTYWSSDLSSAWTDPNTVAIAFGVTIENAIGGAGDDVLIGNAAGNRLDGMGGNDTISGQGGDDILRGLAGNDDLDGGIGLDVAMYGSNRAQNIAIKLANGDIQITGPEGIDTLHAVERAVFTDHALGFDVDGIGGTAYRLYKAAFDRTPDAGGLGFWMYYLDRGFNLVDAADNFLNSDEFRAMYGANPTNDNFVRLLYQHVMHRDPDAEGYAFWNAAMTNQGGAYGHAWTKGEVLTLFADSAENKALVVGVIQDGFDYTPWNG